MSKYIPLLLGLFVSLNLHSQYRTLKGIIQDGRTKEPLVGAAIQMEHTTEGTTANEEGFFQLVTKLKEGTLLVSYIGYQPQKVAFDFRNQAQLTIKISLQSTGVELQEVQVTDRSEGQVKALLEQKRATAIKNIVSIEQIQQFPDQNAAEAIQRIPGITLQRDQGEGRYVQLRGTPPELSNFNINGEQIPSPEGDIRYVALDVIPVDQLESIVISKALTPDQDGDAIGGTVNLITKTARDSIPEIRANLAGGFNNLSQRYNYNAQFSFGQRYRNFGFYLNASHLLDNRASHNIEFAFNESRFAGDTTFRLHYDDVQLRHYEITRKRTGLSATWDFQPDERTLLAVNAIYNRFSDQEFRRRLRYNIGSGFLTSEVSSREAKIERDLKDREKIHEISSLNFRGKKEWRGVKVQLNTSYSVAIEDIPDRFDINFVNDLVNLRLDLSEPNYPRIMFPRERDLNTVFNYADYEFDELLLQQTLTIDKNFSSRLNIEIPFKNSEGSIKFGGRIRLKEKERDNTGQVFHKYFQTFAVNNTRDSIRQIYNQVGPALSLQNVAGTFEDNNLLNRNYEMGLTPDPTLSREFQEFYFQNFKLEESDTKEESLAEDFYATEDIYAAYAMATNYFGDLMLLGGVRFERTNIQYRGFDVQFKAFSDSFDRVDTLRSQQTYDFWLPQFHLKYSPNPQTNYRAAFTYSYSRPNFEDILPYRQSELDSRQITLGNPDLRYAQSMNIDLLAEKYLPKGGILSGGLFYKKIDDFVYYFEQRIRVENISRPGWYFVKTAQNGLDARVLGAEINWNQQFYRLPGIWGNFGIYANYTFTESAAYIANRNEQREKISLPGQARHSANLAFFYDGPKLYAKIAANYADSFLDELGIKPTWDIYYDENLHLDFQLKYQFTPNLNFFINAVNLTNTPLRYYLGEPARVKQTEFYSWWSRIGVKLVY